MSSVNSTVLGYSCEGVFIKEATTDGVDKSLSWEFEGKLKADFLGSEQWRLGRSLWLLWLGLYLPLILRKTRV